MLTATQLEETVSLEDAAIAILRSSVMGGEPPAWSELDRLLETASLQEKQAAARALFRQSLLLHRPMTGPELGEAFGMSGRWGSDRAKEVKESAPAAITAGEPATGETPLTALRSAGPAAEVSAPRDRHRTAVPDRQAGEFRGEGAPARAAAEDRAPVDTGGSPVRRAAHSAITHRGAEAAAGSDPGSDGPAAGESGPADPAAPREGLTGVARHAEGASTVPLTQPGNGRAGRRQQPARGQVSESTLWFAILAGAIVGVVAFLGAYGHLHHLALLAGEGEWSAKLFPASVEGLMVVATLAVITLGTRTAWLTLGLGLGASLAGNALSAAPHLVDPTVLKIAVAVSPPVSLFVVIHLIAALRECLTATTQSMELDSEPALIASHE